MAAQYGFRDGLTEDQVYTLLTLEAQRYVLVQAPKYGRPLEDQQDGHGGVIPGVKSELLANREQFAATLADITGLEPAEARKRVGLT